MPDDRDELVQQFERELYDLDGKAFIVKETEVPVKLQSILSGNIQNVVVYQVPLLEKLLPESSLPKANHLSIHVLPERKPANFNYDEYRKIMIEADAGIIAADYLTADSGSIVLLGEHHRSQMVTLLPSTLIVLATTEQIVEDIDSLHKTLKANNQPESTLHYIAGPSRTADIEKTLILGVHGPKDLYVLVTS